MKKEKWLFGLVIILMLAFGLQLSVTGTNGKTSRDSLAAPRPVTARGGLLQEEQNTIEIFESVSPSVVFITNMALRQNLFSLNVYEIPSGMGSGFIWDEKGRIVTNYHVIENANRIEVTLGDKSIWEAELLGVAPEKDIAVLQINAPANKLKAVPVGESNNLLVGQKVFAIGNPFGLDHTITSGIVSALGREIDSITGQKIEGVIQTDAAINPGNSGGPLLDSAGRLIGINTAIFSPSGGNAGIGFAVPVEVVNKVVPELIKYGRVIRTGMGITIANDIISGRLGLTGVLVIDVQKGGPAETAGLKGTIRKRDGSVVLGDVIKTVNGKEVKSFSDLRNILDEYKPGEKIKVGIERKGKRIMVQVKLVTAG